MFIILFLSITSFLQLLAGRSAGCGKPISKDIKLNKLITRNDDWVVNDYKTFKRTYGIMVPETYDPNKMSPLILYLHGWGSNWHYEALELDYDELGKKHGVITVNPKGMDDHKAFGRWTSWNTGFSGDESVCTNDAEEVEYDSCIDQNMQGKCNCFTCVDDIKSIEILTNLLLNEFCIDTNKMLMTGESNGGMYTYYAMQQNPTLYKHYMPIFGLPLNGQLWFPEKLKGHGLLHYHGLYDTTIPIAGGVSEDGWIYESLRDTVREVAIINECDLNSLVEVVPTFPPRTKYKRKFKAPAEDLIDCFEYTQGCVARVAFCEYDGGHTTWPLQHLADLTYWFYPFLSDKRLNAFEFEEHEAAVKTSASEKLIKKTLPLKPISQRLKNRRVEV